jgi:hypothetical protein
MLRQCGKLDTGGCTGRYNALSPAQAKVERRGWQEERSEIYVRARLIAVNDDEEPSYTSAIRSSGVPIRSKPGGRSGRKAKRLRPRRDAGGVVIGLRCHRPITGRCNHDGSLATARESQLNLQRKGRDQGYSRSVSMRFFDRQHPSVTRGGLSHASSPHRDLCGRAIIASP